MAAKRFKTLSGFLTNVSPVKEGKKQDNWAEGFIQTGATSEEKVLFFFEKPKTSSAAYENAVSAYKEKTAVAWRPGTALDSSLEIPACPP